MAFTTPRTWVTDELVTAAMMNAHVRDNFNAVPHLLAFKSADESVTSSTTLQDDNHLTVVLAASDLWYLSVVLYMVGDAPIPGINVSFSIPASTTMNMGTYFTSASGSDGRISWTDASPTNDLITAATGGIVEIQGIVETGATAGNFLVQWAQASSSGTATTLKKGSAIYGLQLA